MAGYRYILLVLCQLFIVFHHTIGRILTDLNDRALTTIPSSEIANDTTVLYLYNNKLKNITEDSLSHLYQLEKLLLNSNRMTSVGDIRDVGATLLHLQLTSNDLNNIQNGSFDGLDVLEFLDLADNQLHQMPDLSDIGDTLLELRLYDNPDMVDPDQGQMLHLINLHKLVINRCGLTKMPDLSACQDVLEELNISENPGMISPTAASLDVIPSLSSLWKLSISTPPNSNPVSLITSNRLVDLHIKVGWIEGNILHIDASDVEKIPTLTKLSVTYMQWTGATGTPRIVDFPGDPETHVQLKDLNLYQNKLTEVRSLNYLKHSVTIVRLDSNALTSLSASVFSGCVKLQQLLLSSNQITALPYHSRLNIAQFYINKNQMGTVPPTVQGIQDINLADCDISSVTDKESHLFSSATKVYLSSNHLTYLSDLSTMDRLPRLSLEKTELDFCDCRHAWLLSFRDINKVYFSDESTANCLKVGFNWEDVNRNLTEFLAICNATQLPGTDSCFLYHKKYQLINM